MVTYESPRKTNNTQKEKDSGKYEYIEETQTHNHEFLGSTKLPSQDVTEHNHRFAGVTSEVIFVPGGHVHTFMTDTDFFSGHIHGVGGTTDLQVPVDGGKHVHFANDTTTFDACHDHDFQFATLIDDPLV
jgi:hypothetical protein